MGEIKAKRLMLTGNKNNDIEIAFLESINDNIESMLAEIRSTKVLIHELTLKLTKII